MSTESVPVPTLEPDLMDRFGERGDFLPLLQLADYLQELGIRPGFEELLRRVGAAQDDAVRFFYAQAGWSYNPLTESESEGRLRGAVVRARAEAWVKASGAEMIWEVDDWPDRSWMEDEPGGDDGRNLFVAVLQVPVKPWNRTDIGVLTETAGSLGGIDLGPVAGPDHRYCRVVAAELALEAMPTGAPPFEVCTCAAGRRGVWTRVESYEEAVRLVQLWSHNGGSIPESDDDAYAAEPLGVSGWGRGCGNVRDSKSRKVIAHVGYNGRVWEGSAGKWPCDEIKVKPQRLPTSSHRRGR